MLHTVDSLCACLAQYVIKQLLRRNIAACPGHNPAFIVFSEDTVTDQQLDLLFDREPDQVACVACFAVRADRKTAMREGSIGRVSRWRRNAPVAADGRMNRPCASRKVAAKPRTAKARVVEVTRIRCRLRIRHKMGAP